MVWSINLDRGVISATHPSLGMDIYMYVDDPGKYLTAHGDDVPEALAQQAGFETEKYAKDRRLKEALAAAQASIMEKMDVPTTKVVKEANGFKIMSLGLGRHNVLTEDGDVLNNAPLPLEQAEILLTHLAKMNDDKKKK